MRDYTQEAVDDLGLDCPAYHSPEVLELEQRDMEDTSGPRTKEAAAMLQEETDHSVSKYRWKGQTELERRRIGKVMNLGEFLRRLRRISPTFKAGDFGAMGLVGLYKGAQYICGIMPGAMPEYSQLRVDERGLPTKERLRGWRTVLLNLVQAKAITEAEAHKHFGKPEGIEAQFYLKRLQELRQAHYDG